MTSGTRQSASLRIVRKCAKWSRHRSASFAVAIITLMLFTGCSAMNSLIIHPLKKLHEMHEYNEAEKAAQKESNHQ
jgi:hypothetical protein